MSEKILEQSILHYLNLQPGWFAFKYYSVGIFDPGGFYRKKSRFAPNGISDIIGLYNGRFIAIEVKIKGNKPTEQQQAFINKVNKTGGAATWVDSLIKAMEFVNELVERNTAND